MIEPTYPEGAYIPPLPPQNVLDARNQAFENANFICTVQVDGCTTKGVFAHQKKLIILSGREDYAYTNKSVLQYPDNLVVCCGVCHKWIHNNQEEATALGYLDR